MKRKTVSSSKDLNTKIKKYAPYATIIALILTVYFGIIGGGNNTRESYDVESYNQSGGITAGKIENLTIVGQSKHVTESFIDQLRPYLPSDKTKEITIGSSMDQATFQYAYELKERLEAEGWGVSEVSQRVYSKPVSGVHVFTDSNNEIVEIVVYSLD